MKLVFLTSFFLMVSCGSTPSGSPHSGKNVYSYTDVSGTFRLQRESKLTKGRLVTRSLISDGTSQKTVEKSITLSQIGSIKDKARRLLTLRPFASEFTVWLEGQKYSSVMRLNPKNKTMVVRLESPEARWMGTQEIPFPKAKYFCFYSQIPDCLYHNHFLETAYKNPKHRKEFFVVWDSWPFIQDQLTNVGKNLFARASLKFDGEVKKELRYIVEIEGQIILYHFSKSYDLVKISWIAQGITVVPPGEESSNDDE